ncbi:unnamed protein product [Polarella glacialis]|uniref:t-SNARE coiled-coil homology domain-containing protein n=1 Tax=Polarella glacialis TaxID=89957 RepID=A0A813F8C5_POLGL|nr:unnamed protein product [Polarella glacialis]
MADQWLRDFEKAKRSSVQLAREVGNSEHDRKPEARTAALLRGQLAQLRQDVVHLQQSLMGMSQNIQASNITRKELSRRGDILAQLSDQADRLQEAVRSGVRRQVDGSDPPWKEAGRGSSHEPVPSAGNLMSMSEQETVNQEETLDFLSGSIANLKQMGGGISQEIDLHCSLLGDMEGQADNATGRIQNQQKKLQELSQHSELCCLWVCICVMIVAIFVLLVFF